MAIKHQAHYAAYYNMARHNLFVTLKHISNVAHINAIYKDTDESKMAEMEVVRKLKSGTAEEKMNIERLIYRHMPFMRPVVEFRRQENNRNPEKKRLSCRSHTLLHDALTDWCKVLTYHRDRYTHYYFNDERTHKAEYIDCEKQVVKDLNMLFIAAARLVKERFSLTTHLEFLTKSRYITKTLRDATGRVCKDENGKPKKITQLNPLSFYSLQNNEEMLNNMGLTFLLCQFIEKKYATLLFDQLNYEIYENHGEERRRYIREVFSAYRLNIPRERLDVERNDISLAMDMLNELRKCPAELFDVISPEEQERFRIISDVTQEEVLLRRRTDRFATLALEYIDFSKMFNKIRFQVSLGKYRYKFYDKTCIDGNSYIRTLQKELNGFGRLNEIEAKRRESWSSLIRYHEDVSADTVNTQPYITDHHAQYIINGNRIGMYFNGHDHHALNYGVYLPPIHDDKAPCLQPICNMSTYELPALLFHHILTKSKQPGATEQILIDTVERYNRFFTDIAHGTLTCSYNVERDFAYIYKTYGIRRKDMPQELEDYFSLQGHYRNGFEELSRKRIEQMIIETEDLQRIFSKMKYDVSSNEDIFKYGKRDYVEIRPGRLAAFLAEDIVLLMPNANNKPTGKNYSVLQAQLATFDVANNKYAVDDLICTLQDLNAIRNDNEDDDHPFIDSILDPVDNKRPRNTIELYEKYLAARLEYLRNVNNKKSLQYVSFLHASRKRWQARNEKYYQELAMRYATQPIELPRGIFDEAIRKELSTYDELKLASCDAKNNVAHLIALYMQVVCKDNCQRFYNLPRHYSVLGGKGTYFIREERDAFTEKLKMAKGGTIKQRLLSLFYQMTYDEQRDFKKRYKVESNNSNRGDVNKKIIEILSSLYKQMYDNERILRRYRVQDMLLYMLACDIIKGEMCEDFGHRLKMIADEQDTAFFDYKMPLYSTDVTLADGRKCKLIQRDIKLKNYGDLYRFIYDTRVRSLLGNSDMAEIECNILDEELTEYDECRPEVFDIILRIEKTIVDNNPQLRGERINFRRVLEVMTEKNEVEKEILRLVRNGFSHNYYPSIEGVDYKCVPSVAKNIKKLIDLVS